MSCTVIHCGPRNQRHRSSFFVQLLQSATCLDAFARSHEPPSMSALVRGWVWTLTSVRLGSLLIAYGRVLVSGSRLTRVHQQAHVVRTLRLKAQPATYPSPQGLNRLAVLKHQGLEPGHLPRGLPLHVQKASGSRAARAGWSLVS